MREGRLKAGLLQLLDGSGAAGLAQMLARGVPILAYHGVTSADAPEVNLRRLHVPRALFERHVAFLAARHRPMGLEQLRTLLAAGRALPRGAVVITFDDGYRNFATQAWPVLERHGVPATLFVVGDGGQGRFWQDRVEAAVLAARVAAVEWHGARLPLASPADRAAAARRIVAALEAPRVPAEAVLAALLEQLGSPEARADEDRDRLDWRELRQLREAGVELGSHADRHEALTARQDDVQAALAGNHAALVQALGPGPYALSYPFGARSPAIRSAARAAGFSCALSGRPGLARAGTDLHDLPRLLVGADDDLGRLRLSLSGLRALWQGDPWPGQGMGSHP